VTSFPKEGHNLCIYTRNTLCPERLEVNSLSFSLSDEFQASNGRRHTYDVISMTSTCDRANVLTVQSNIGLVQFLDKGMILFELRNKLIIIIIINIITTTTIIIIIIMFLKC